MRLPFSRTLACLPRLGLKRTLYLALAVSLSDLNRLKHLKRLPEAAVIELRTGNKMIVRPKKGLGDVHHDLFLYRIREPFPTTYLINSGILQKGDVALDIGANIGYYALIEAKLVGPEGCVYAVEPVSENVELLKANVVLNGYKNVQIHQLALGAHNGKAEIHVAEKPNWSGIIKNQYIKYIRTEEVAIMTVDEFLKNKRKPKLIRMDVEGYEYEILKGMEDTLKMSPLFLFVELHTHLLGEDKTKEVLEVLEQNGFEVKYVSCFPGVVGRREAKFLEKAGISFQVYDVSIRQLKELCESQRLFHIIFSKGRS